MTTALSVLAGFWLGLACYAVGMWTGMTTARRRPICLTINIRPEEDEDD